MQSMYFALFFSNFEVLPQRLQIDSFLFNPQIWLGCLSYRVFKNFESTFKSLEFGDFPGGPMVKNLPSNAGDMGWIPGWGTKIPHAALISDFQPLVL